jgi:hypothetical protein
MLLHWILFAVLVGSQAQLAPDNHASLSHRPPKPAVTGERAVLPLEFTSGFPTITARIDDRNVRLGFDTGAPGGPRLSPAVIAELRLTQVGEALASDPSGRNPVRLKMYGLPQIAFGGVEVRGWVASEARMLNGPIATLDGIVGPNAFEGYVVTIDYAARRFVLERAALPNPDGKTVFAYAAGPVAVVPLTVEGRTIEAHLDTGNIRFPIIVPEGFASTLAGIASARPIGTARTVTQRFEMKAAPISGPARVGETTLAAGEVGFPTATARANIGSLALAGMVIRVDPANRRVELRSNSPT